MLYVLKQNRGYIKQVQSRILFLKMLLEYENIELKECYLEDTLIIRLLNNSNKGIGVSIKYDDFMNTHIVNLCVFIINLLEKER